MRADYSRLLIATESFLEELNELEEIYELLTEDEMLEIMSYFGVIRDNLESLFKKFIKDIVVT